jgi:hypothetical protein
MRLLIIDGASFIGSNPALVPGPTDRQPLIDPTMATVIASTR